MFAHFLPSSVVEIQDAGAIALLQKIQRRVADVPFQQGAIAIATAYAHYIPDAPLHSSLSTDPILLLHGFDSSLLEFRRLLPLLGESQETWAIDLFGAGFTSMSRQCRLIPKQSDNICSTL